MTVKNGRRASRKTQQREHGRRGQLGVAYARVAPEHSERFEAFADKGAHIAGNVGKTGHAAPRGGL